MNLANLAKLNVVGPFWSAEVEVVTLDAPQRNLALRRLWLDTTPRKVAGSNNVLVPGTILALCLPQQVRITPASGTAATFEWKRPPNATAPALATFDEVQAAVQSGAVSLLLLEANAASWPTATSGKPPVMTCLAGEIALDPLAPQKNALKRLYDTLTLTAPGANVRPPGALSVHASGLSIMGSIALPWQDQQVAALFQLAKVLPPPGVSAPAFRLTIEVERLTATERQELIAAAQRLSAMLNPRYPLNDLLQPQAAAPRWATLELVNPTAPPQIVWPIAPWGTFDNLTFERGEMNLLLSDRPPYDVDRPPDSLARVIPDAVSIAPAADGTLAVVIKAGAAPDPAAAPPPDSLAYRYVAGSEERLQLRELATSFSPTETPELLRVAQDLPVPEWDNDQVAPLPQPLVWGFTPLDDGWMQLPIPNLSEQIYVDADLAQFSSLTGGEPLDGARPSVIQGAVSFTNRRADGGLVDPAEHPWAVTLTNTPGLAGTWSLTKSDSSFVLGEIQLTVLQPDMVITGLFWLSTARPTVGDALPNFDNWVAGLRAVPLQRVHTQVIDGTTVAADLFPSLLVLRLHELAINAPPADDNLPAYDALLKNWSLTLEVDNPTVAVPVPGGGQALTTLVERLFGGETPVLPSDLFSRYEPLFWRRHRVLPLVQALPLTQTKNPPNEPIASRQFAPFALPISTSPGLPLVTPAGWQFGVSVGSGSAASGASTWPRLQNPTELPPAREWRVLPDLPMAALSLPGLQFDASGFGTVSGLESSLLPLQYRYDLPYTDEIQALAQLPPQRRAPELVSPLPDEPPEALQPLMRATYAEHWQRLSQMASLAAADTVAAFGSENGQTVVRGLVEPLVWPVQLVVDLETYPGALTVGEAGGSEPLILRGDAAAPDAAGSITPGGSNAALRGFSGRFVAQTNGTLGLANATDPAPFLVEAGSMAAHPNGDGTFRDQRGLSRAATSQQGELLSTTLRLEASTFGADPDTVVLTSASVALNLRIAPSHDWRLWFRDLPVRGNTFLRANGASPAAEDVNDPEALAREFNHLHGYEWRLSDAATVAVGVPMVRLCGLEFFPLTLERLDLIDNQVQRVELVGRLQLPLQAQPDEIADLNNAVRATFTRSDGELGLAELALLADQGEWPLALNKGELGNDPRIIWTGLNYNPTTSTLVLTEARLCFSLFDSEWQLPLKHGTAQFTAAAELVTPELELPSADGPLVPIGASLTLNLKAATTAVAVADEPPADVHRVSLDLAVRLGRSLVAAGGAGRAAFTATVQFTVLAGEAAPPRVVQAALFDDITLLGAGPGTSTLELLVNQRVLSFVWNAWQSAHDGLQILPGMPLAGDAAPGCATLTFAATTTASGIPQLDLKLGFVETVLHARWGVFLQTDTQPVEAQRQQVYGSSAGDLALGYTAHATTENGALGWDEHLLLNGMLEIKSLISWPADMRFDRASSTLSLPPAQTSGVADSLDHVRHTMRVLFNQHRLPTEVLVLVESQDLLFNLLPNRPWQTLAVVEHQLIDVREQSRSAGEPVLRVGADRRWTVTQEVRVMAPTVLRGFLQRYGNPNLRSIDPVAGLAPLTDGGEGYFVSEVREALLAELDRLPTEVPCLLVEASALHWLRQKPVQNARATVLQHLPGGSQHAILSGPDDYTSATSATDNAGWLLLSTPLLGRLQPAYTDGLDPNSGAATAGPLMVDPVLVLQRLLKLGTPPPYAGLAFALTHRGNLSTIDVQLAHLDTAAGRTWSRLDPLTLSENWFRLQLPFAEPMPLRLASVMAALPDTPARASRSVALRRAFDVFRPFVPPVDVRAFPLPGGNGFDYQLPPEIIETELVWRQGNLLAPASVRKLRMQPTPQITDGLQALYTFAEGSGNTINDVSGVGTALNLRITELDDVTWLPDGGLRVTAATLIESRTAATKLFDACKATNQITIEVWIKPARLKLPDQGIPARIVTISTNVSNRNVSLQQGMAGRDNAAFYHARIRNKRDDNEGMPPVMTATGSLSTKLTHVVYTFDASGVGRIYLDGVERGLTVIGGSFGTWDSGYRLALANEFTKDRPWLGEYHAVAIYNRALSAVEIAQQYAPHTRAFGGAWHSTAALLCSSGLAGMGSSATGINRYPAATLLPARLTVELPRNGSTVVVPNPQPLGFAISPYLGLSFRSAPPTEQRRRALVAAELIAIDPSTGQLLPVAQRFFEQTATQAEDDTLHAQIEGWAQQMHQQLTPESPLAVLRLRDVYMQTEGVEAETAAVVTGFRFTLVRDLTPPPSLSRSVGRLRAAVETLRFREGQYGGAAMPEAVQPFELAPPQVIGAQPIYLTERPNAPSSAGSTWPWGVSALRFSVRYTEGGRGIVGQQLRGDQSAESAAPTLWWQAIQHGVQFRSALRETPLFALPPTLANTLAPGPAAPELLAAFEVEGLPLAAGSMVSAQQPDTVWQIDDAESHVRYVLRKRGATLQVARSAASAAGLPTRFRSTPIRHLMPVLPDPPLPVEQPYDWLTPVEPSDTPLTVEQSWQPVLPGAVRYLLIGGRSGVMTGVRHQLIRQRKGTLVSGSVPVQHRVPRPVPLPANRAAAQDDATQTWASYFEPERNLLLSREPVDETFYAATGDHGPSRLQLRLVKPERGTLPVDWNGALEFEALQQESSLDAGETVQIPTLVVSLLVGGEQFTYEALHSIDMIMPTPDPSAPAPNHKQATITASSSQIETLKRLVAALPPGTEALVQVKATPIATFGQTLTFALRSADPNALPLPLEPHSIHFEDPEYNRALVTQAGRAERLIKLAKKVDPNEIGVFTITLTTDRRTYNPFSPLALRYDWDSSALQRPPGTAVHVLLHRITTNGITQELITSDLAPGEPLIVLPGELLQLSLAGLRLKPTVASGATTDEQAVGKRFALNPDDKLRITLFPSDTPAEWGDYTRPMPSVLLVPIEVDILAEPVIPAPEAAYALLRQQTISSQSQVECVRFAWGPNASRIELVAADDLLLGVVRRRAVFQWRDVARTGSATGYAVQKIAANGATHVPTWEKGTVKLTQKQE